MNLTIACYTAQAYQRAGYEAEINHTECRNKGGVIYEMPSDPLPGEIQLGRPCECTCHLGQRRWYPTESKRTSKSGGIVKPATGIGPMWTFDV